MAKRTSTVELAHLASSQDGPGAASEPTLMDQAGAAVGKLIGLAADGAPLVTVDGATGRAPARTCLPLEADDVGRDVVLLFEGGNRDKPIVMGLVQRPGERKAIVLNAEDGITLRSGVASITLTRDGKIVIRGAHVVSHASGVNRIRGGSVELN